MEQNKAKEIPYSVSEFVTIVEQNIYYVDKTMYIPELENQARNLFFIRPRRFGKSVFLGMLHAYYDCRTKDKFQQWFGDLWIGKHPTPLQGRYQVLHLDFSQVGGTIEKLEENLAQRICSVAGAGVQPLLTKNNSSKPNPHTYGVLCHISVCR